MEVPDEVARKILWDMWLGLEFHLRTAKGIIANEGATREDFDRWKKDMGSFVTKYDRTMDDIEEYIEGVLTK
jgi:hypothetical protein